MYFRQLEAGDINLAQLEVKQKKLFFFGTNDPCVACYWFVPSLKSKA